MHRRRRLQYFWEVFPARDGLTTYMFAYCDPAKGAVAFPHPFRVLHRHEVCSMHAWWVQMRHMLTPIGIYRTMTGCPGWPSLREVFLDACTCPPRGP